MTDIDMTPLSADDVWRNADVVDGIRIIWLGEDGDWVITPGHDVEPARFLAAADLDLVVNLGRAVSRCWLMATRHRPNCRDDGDDYCSCSNEFDWWGEFPDEFTEGAIAVTRWDS